MREDELRLAATVEIESMFRRLLLKNTRSNKQNGSGIVIYSVIFQIPLIRNRQKKI